MKIPHTENMVYYGVCILTFGMPWVLKIIIKKAITESTQHGK